ncbi:hypothetical protein OO012_00855 [Rhodobacteraceae bacterium KMM 6894]|nr:hypothetical protein [Rhodobacteraceae bacterium KMM 6894]
MLDVILIALALGLGMGGGEGAAPAVDVGGFQAEPQTPTGKFTTATEVKPILGMTRANWVGVREYGGQDLIYFTHLLAWRCGVHQIRYGVNGDPMQVWDMPPCQDDTNTPNAIDTEYGLSYIARPLGNVRTLSVALLYDDMTTETADFQRSDILMP